jgi:hypothetical protein
MFLYILINNIMNKNVWGPIVWTTLHVLTVQIKDEYFESAKKELIELIISILSNLPCPNCSGHAIKMTQQYRMKTIRTKEQLITCLYSMHNDVNKRLKKPLFLKENVVSTYEGMDFKQVIIDYYNINKQFSYAEKMMIYNYHRKQFLHKFKLYIINHKNYFI